MRPTFLLGALLLGSLLLGCTSGDEATSSPTATASSSATASVTASATGTPTPSDAPSGTPGTTSTPPAQTPSPEAPTGTPPAQNPADSAVAAAYEALASWLGPVADPSAIDTRAVEAVTWPDGCLGIGRAGIACTDALVPGYRVILNIGENEYEVRTDASGAQTAWAPDTQVLVRVVESVTNIAVFVTDDGNLLETRLVLGTQFGLDLVDLPADTVVAIAIASAPQNGPPLLVWVDPALLD